MLTKIIRGFTMAERLRHTGTLLNPHRQFSSLKTGSKYGPTFKQYLLLANYEVGSYFHDIPLNMNLENRTVRMIVEVPRWSNGKFEISRDIDFNPIVQDFKKGKVRFVHNIFPYHGYIHNYGAIPQTWEDPTREVPGLNSLTGDNDPLDCCEIGSSILHMGDIREVKVLGSIALIDDGELDWKVIAINVQDPLADKVHNLEDVEAYMPGLLHATREWFRRYKVPTGNPPNQFAFNEEYKDVHETINTIHECHESWRRLVSGNARGKKIPSIKRAGKGHKIECLEEEETPIPPEVGAWHYV